MRGGGPSPAPTTPACQTSSPHARGWSQEAQLPRDDGHVFPACAGVVPRERRTAMSKWSLPRMRGGGPPRQPPQTNPTKSSPHARGWSFSFSSASLARSVFPACAGVVPHNRRSPRPRHSLPRMRGGGPRPPDLRAVRGSSSPHARGWSAGDVCDFVDGEVFPACAGVVRMSSRRTRSRSGLPRMRGGGPQPVAATITPPMSSPHARGWSLVKSTPPSTSPVFPACAGVVPHQPQQRRHARRLPRMRGGGPKKPSYLAMMDMSSPHARGWSHAKGERQ